MMRRRAGLRALPAICAGLCVVLCAAPSALAQKKDHLDLYKRGVDALEQNKVAEAERLFRQAIEIQSKEQGSAYGVIKKRDYLPHYQLGAIQARQKDCRGALASFQASESFAVVQKSDVWADLQRRRSLCETAVRQLDEAATRARSSFAAARKAVDTARGFAAKRELGSFWQEGTPTWQSLLDDAQAKLGAAEKAGVGFAPGVEDEVWQEANALAVEAGSRANAVETAARQKLGELTKAATQALGTLDEAEVAAQEVLRAVGPMAPYPPKLGAQVSILQGLVAQVSRLRESRDSGSAPAMVEQLGKETRTLRALSAWPPTALTDGADAFLQGDMAKAIEVLSAKPGKDDREKFFRALLLAAARFHQWVAGGEQDAALWSRVDADLREAAAFNPAPGVVGERFFSPRFRELWSRAAPPPKP